MGSENYQRHDPRTGLMPKVDFEWNLSAPATPAEATPPMTEERLEEIRRCAAELVPSISDYFATTGTAREARARLRVENDVAEMREALGPEPAALAGGAPADLAGLLTAWYDECRAYWENPSGEMGKRVREAKHALDRRLASLQQRAERAEGENTRLRRSLETSTARLEICRDRFAGCDHDGDPNNPRHPVSALELPAWIEEQRAALASPAERTTERSDA